MPRLLSLRRFILITAASLLLALLGCAAAYRWWLTRRDGQDVSESPRGTYQIVLTAETQWMAILPNKNVWIDVQRQSGRMFNGFYLYKLHPSEDLRTAKYNRIWIRENALQLRSNEDIADDCDQLNVLNDTQNPLQYLVVHTGDIVLLLNFGAGEVLSIPITRPANSANGYVSAYGAFATGRTLPLQQRYSKDWREVGQLRFTVAVTDQGFEFNVLPLRGKGKGHSCQTTGLP